jgi:hypothetical protein
MRDRFGGKILKPKGGPRVPSLRCGRDDKGRGAAKFESLPDGLLYFPLNFGSVPGAPGECSWLFYFRRQRKNRGWAETWPPWLKPRIDCPAYKRV